ncbi:MULTISPECIES: hypothetical protein [unclassified Streptomyces]|uniref:hypothetical protein n=1 Tax=unclassified Streptomyces TaxID=2593676 RepID=UPI000ADC69F2|nr:MULTISPECIES: hypothetical protein [unclassified Streptomyces]
MSRTHTAMALGVLAAALVTLAGHAAASAATAGERETGTVKTVVVASAGDKKVEVIKA